MGIFGEDGFFRFRPRKLYIPSESLPSMGFDFRRKKKGQSSVATPSYFKQRVVTKTYICRRRDHATLLAHHITYIQREGVGMNGNPPELFGQDDLSPVPIDLLPGEKHHFRMIISPENGHKLSLRVFARSIMHELTQEMGQPLQWAAVAHYNTGRPHLHLVIRGLDAINHMVRIPADVINGGLRRMAVDLATRSIGPLSAYEVRGIKDREVSQHRFTSLDARLLRRQANPLPWLKEDRLVAPKEPFLQRRLSYLASIGLAHPTVVQVPSVQNPKSTRRYSVRAYSLHPFLEKILRDAGRSRDFIARMIAQPVSWEVPTNGRIIARRRVREDSDVFVYTALMPTHERVVFHSSHRFRIGTELNSLGGSYGAGHASSRRP